MTDSSDAAAHDRRDGQAIDRNGRATRRIAGLRLREIDNSPAGLRTLARFYRERYVAEFPDPDERESLANMRRYLALKAKGWYGANNYHIVIAELGGEAVGGVVFDYLAAADAGVIEFLFVVAVHRVGGLGGALLDESVRILRADARERSARPLKAVVAEMNDPYRRPRTPDNMDPFRRAAIWGKWGFQALGFPYVQPALSAGQKPVDGLLLIARLFGRAPRTGVPAAWVDRVVTEYLRWAMRIDDPAANRDCVAMADFLAARRRIGLCPLQHYIGHDPQRAFEVEEIAAGEDSDAFADTLALTRAAIPFPGRVASPAEFSAALAAARAYGPAYHLWALRAPAGRVIEGMASFFTLKSAGFGGYIVLGGALRGRGLLTQLVARIEARMVHDGTCAEGWFIECGEESAAAFLRAGFVEIPLEYRPPRVGDQATSAPERLQLLYKPFGMACRAPRLTDKFILRALREILHDVYGIASPRRHACYHLARRTLSDAMASGSAGSVTASGTALASRPP